MPILVAVCADRVQCENVGSAAKCFLALTVALAGGNLRYNHALVFALDLIRCAILDLHRHRTNFSPFRSTLTSRAPQVHQLTPKPRLFYVNLKHTAVG